jgi:hypothetical protein
MHDIVKKYSDTHTVSIVVGEGKGEGNDNKYHTSFGVSINQ